MNRETLEMLEAASQLKMARAFFTFVAGLAIGTLLGVVVGSYFEQRKNVDAQKEEPKVTAPKKETPEPTFTPRVI